MQRLKDAEERGYARAKKELGVEYRPEIEREHIQHQVLS